MDFNLSREHQLVRKMMAEFTENEVKPIAAETDKTSQYPRENIEKLFNLGVMGMCVPKEYGGAGADPLASAICIEELSKHAPPPATSWPPTTACAAIPSSPTAPRPRRPSTCPC